MAAAGKCEAHQLRAGTYVPSARGAALAELACPADASAGGVSHRGAALGEQGRAGQGRQDSCAAGLARVWRPALVPPLVPRTSQWHAVPSHAPGCLAPEVARAGTEGWGDPGLHPRPCRKPPAGGATPLSQGIPGRGHPDASPPRTFSEVLKTAPLSRDCKHPSMSR